MNRPALRLIGALLALVSAAAVLGVTVSGLIGLLLTLVLTEPWSQGGIVAATMTAAGVALLLVAHALDREALPRAVTASRTVSAGLALTVRTGGRQ